MTFLRQLSASFTQCFRPAETSSELKKRVPEDDPPPAPLLSAINVQNWERDWAERYVIMTALCEHFGEESLEDELACLANITKSKAADPWFARQADQDPITQLINFMRAYEVCPSTIAME